MNSVFIFQDKVDFVVWRTKGGRHIPLFGKGESRWTPGQTKKWKKDAPTRKKAGIKKRKATIEKKKIKDIKSKELKTEREKFKKTEDEYFEIANEHGSRSILARKAKDKRLIASKRLNKMEKEMGESLTERKPVPKVKAKVKPKKELVGKSKLTPLPSEGTISSTPQKERLSSFKHEDSGLEILVPAGKNSRKDAEFVSAAMDKLPHGKDGKILLHESLKGHKIAFVTEAIPSGHRNASSGFAIGHYHKGRKEIIATKKGIGTRQSAQERERSILHEFGHAYVDRGKTGKFRTAHHTDKQFVSGYAKSGGWEEDYCESFSFWRQGKGVLLSSGKRSELEQIFGKM